VIAGFTETKHAGEDMMKLRVETWWKGTGNSVDMVQSEALSNKSDMVFSWNPDYFKKTGDTYFNNYIRFTYNTIKTIKQNLLFM
jgi:hypothetical protein